GHTMVEGENLLLNERPDACILRISLPMGVSFNGHAGAVDWIQSRFQKNKPATLYFDEVRTPTYVECLNQAIAAVLSNQLAGIYHCGGPHKMSLFEIAQVVNRIGGYPPELLQGCPRIEAGPVPPRAGNVTMNSSKLLRAMPELTIDPWPLCPEHVPTHRNWHFERGHDEQGSLKKLQETLYAKPFGQNL
ncbi:MAG: sugar nucleotide-binding protein, partial [Pirellulaceae bacterium]|nr:sugar nucleotide-binding protein [Pirellulaceae bacterium]